MQYMILTILTVKLHPIGKDNYALIVLYKLLVQTKVYTPDLLSYNLLSMIPVLSDIKEI